MFTWIITHQTKILSIKDWVFTVENNFGNTLPLHEGQSIAHDWACMTVTEFDDKKYSFFAMEESFRKTNFWTKKAWDLFNLELCMQAWDRLDGHFVSWHIDTIWTVSDIEMAEDGSKKIWFSYNKERSLNVIKKWSITINWISLTVVDVDDWYLSVWLIPLTQEITNLWTIVIWNQVNLEFDMLWKYVINYNKSLQ